MRRRKVTYPPAKTATKGPPPVLGATDLPVVIDHGCPFLNTCFDDGKDDTRVAALWDQGGTPERKPPREGQPQGRDQPPQQPYGGQPGYGGYGQKPYKRRKGFLEELFD